MINKFSMSLQLPSSSHTIMTINQIITIML